MHAGSFPNVILAARQSHSPPKPAPLWRTVSPQRWSVDLRFVIVRAKSRRRPSIISGGGVMTTLLFRQFDSCCESPSLRPLFSSDSSICAKIRRHTVQSCGPRNAATCLPTHDGGWSPAQALRSRRSVAQQAPRTPFAVKGNSVVSIMGTALRTIIAHPAMA